MSVSPDQAKPESNAEIHRTASFVVKLLAFGSATTVVVLLGVLAMKADNFIVTMILIFAVAEVAGLALAVKLIRRNEQRQVEQLAERRRAEGKTVYPDVGV